MKPSPEWRRLFTIPDGQRSLTRWRAVLSSKRLTNAHTSGHGLDTGDPPVYPPPDDFVIHEGPNGRKVLVGEDIWDLSSWAREPFRLFFSTTDAFDDVTRRNNVMFKSIVTWWIYDQRQSIAPKTLRARYVMLRRLVRLASDEGVPLSRLSNFPRVMASFLDGSGESVRWRVHTLLHRIYEARAALGFYVLDQEALRAYAAVVARPDGRQTPYIPPRIWSYVLGRCREVLEDFSTHTETIRSMFQFCSTAYEDSYGSLAEAYSPDRNNWRNPFGEGSSTYPTFEGALEKFGLSSLLSRWLVHSKKGRSVKAFASYLTFVQLVGATYIAALTFMRIGEVMNLRSSCLSLEVDPDFGEIWMLCGETTKTDPDIRE